MIVGIKCDGCGMWTRVIDLYHQVQKHNIDCPYYCNECQNNVTYHTTKARITIK